MLKIFFLLLLLSLSLQEDPKNGKTLIWSDEFDSTTLDQSKWTFEIGNNYGWGNNELEYYTDRSENCYLTGGFLHIRAKREDYEGFKYTSSRIKTQGKFSFQYGYAEARMSIPLSMGIWPAFWMLGENINEVSWPKCGEIDIMEAVNREAKVYATNHWDENGHAQYGNVSPQFDITQFHVYGMEWTDKVIRVFVDGEKFHEIDIEGSKGGTDEFHKPFFFLLNVAVGGSWPGYDIEENALPQELIVDYVRVYK